MKAVGFACDVCKVFATSEKSDRPPNGWMTLTTHTDQHTPMDSFHICSNKCLRDLGKVRYASDRGVIQNGSSPIVSREVSDEGRVAMRQNGLRMAHRRNNHSETPNPDCPLCQEEFGLDNEGLKGLLDQMAK